MSTLKWVICSSKKNVFPAVYLTHEWTKEQPPKKTLQNSPIFANSSTRVPRPLFLFPLRKKNARSNLPGSPRSSISPSLLPAPLRRAKTSWCCCSCCSCPRAWREWRTSGTETGVVCSRKRRMRASWCVTVKKSQTPRKLFLPALSSTVPRYPSECGGRGRQFWRLGFSVHLPKEDWGGKEMPAAQEDCVFSSRRRPPPSPSFPLSLSMQCAASPHKKNSLYFFRGNPAVGSSLLLCGMEGSPKKPGGGKRRWGERKGSFTSFS